MDLTQLQAELRAVENKMSELQAEIEKMKPRPQADLAADYAKIARSAKQVPVNNLLVSAADDYTKKSYLSGLAYLSFAGQPVDMDRLLYLTALSIGIGCGYEPENLVTLGMRMDENAFEAVSEAVRPHRYAFLVDALVLANIHGAAEPSVLESLAALSHILGCGVEDMKMAAQVAKAVLTQDFDALDKVPPELACQYTGQFTGHIPESWLAKRRIRHWEKKPIDKAIFSGHKNRQIKTNGTLVQVGDIILSYEYKTRNSRALAAMMRAGTGIYKKYTLLAEANGCFYTVERSGKIKDSDGTELSWNKTYYYVISPFDTLANLEKWHDKQHPHPEKE